MRVRYHRHRVQAFVGSPLGRKAIRYTMVSVVNVVLGETLLGLAFGLWHWSARSSALFSTCIATVPAYLLSRAWVWGKGGRSHLLKEVLPFWVMALAGLALSTWAAEVAESFSRRVTTVRLEQTVIVMSSSLLGFGVLWIVRFVVLNSLIFSAPAAHPLD